MRSPRRVLRRGRVAALVSATSLLSLAACRDETPITGLGPPTPPAEPPSIRFVIPGCGETSNDLAFFTVIGDTWVWPVQVARRGGYDGAVDLTIEGVIPAGVTVKFDPASLGAEATATELSIAAASDMEPLAFEATLRARGNAVREATCVVEIGVAPPWLHNVTHDFRTPSRRL